MAEPNAPDQVSRSPEAADPIPSESQPQEQPMDSTPTEPSSSQSSSSAPQVCTSCKKTLELPKPCPRCHTTPYCSRECQKTDYKKHKKVCAELAQKYATTADIKMATTRVPPKNERRGGLQKWQFDT